MQFSLRFSLSVVVALLTAFGQPAKPAPQDDYVVLPGPSGLLPNLPDAVVGLRTKAGADMVGAHWSFREARIQQTAFRGSGRDLGPTGKPTLDRSSRP